MTIARRKNARSSCCKASCHITTTPPMVSVATPTSGVGWWQQHATGRIKQQHDTFEATTLDWSTPLGPTQNTQRTTVGDGILQLTAKGCCGGIIDQNPAATISTTTPTQSATSSPTKTTVITTTTRYVGERSEPATTSCSLKTTATIRTTTTTPPNCAVKTPTNTSATPISVAVSSSMCAAAWLLPVLCLSALFVGSQAGFACLSNPCLFGVCIDGLNSSYSCYCIDGYTGIQCQTNWDECWSGPCQNGGTCVDGVAYYNCTCPEGFTGASCEENVDECKSNPCQNGGHCRDRTNGYTCTCLPGYLGTHCEQDVAVCDTGVGARCDHGGECIEGRGLEFSCVCTKGWHGRLCQEEINECESSPCQNGGVCVDKLAAYACACPMGYAGTNCEEEILICADNPCKNNALCLMEENVPTCYCVPDYHGEKCEYQYDECQLGPRCMNGGVCIDGVDTFSCSCPPQLTGMLCECLMIGGNEQELDCNITSGSMATWRPPTTTTTTSTTTTTTEEPPEPPPTPPPTSIITAMPPSWESSASTEVTHEETDISVAVGVAVTTEHATLPPASSISSEEDGGEGSSAGGGGSSVSSLHTTTMHPISSETSSSSSESTFGGTIGGEGEKDEKDEKDDKDDEGPSSGSVEFTTPRPAISQHPVSEETAGSSGTENSDADDDDDDDGIIPSHTITIRPTVTFHVTTIETSVSVTARPVWATPTTPTPTHIWTDVPTTAVPFFTERPQMRTTSSSPTGTGTGTGSGSGSGSESSTSSEDTDSKSGAGGEGDTDGDDENENDHSGAGEDRDGDENEIGGVGFTTIMPHQHHHHHHHYHHHHYDHHVTSTSTTTTTTTTTTTKPTMGGNGWDHHHEDHHHHHDHSSEEDEESHEIDQKPPTTPPAMPTVPYVVETTPKPPATDDLIVIATTPPTPMATTLAESGEELPSSSVTTTVLPPPSVVSVATDWIPMATLPPPATTIVALPSPEIPPSETSTEETELPSIPPLPPLPTTQPPPAATLSPTTATEITQLPPMPITTIMPQPLTTTESPSIPSVATIPPIAPPTSPPSPSVTSAPATTMITRTLPPLSTTAASSSSEEDNTDGTNTVPTGVELPGRIPGTTVDVAENGSDADCLKIGCYNGGTCVTTSEGSRCVCRFDRQGALCEVPIVIRNAAFSGDSYVSHRIHKDIQINDPLDNILPMHVQLKVRTRATNGLIMLAAAQGTKGGHYMALFLQKGLLQFQFSCGLQTMLLSELETPVNTGNEITIRAELDFSRNYTHCNASLLVNDTLAMSGDQPTWLKLLPPRLHTAEVILNTWLHLGGAPQAPIGLIIELPPAQSGTGFTGCLHTLRINEQSRDIFGDAMDGFGITECGSLACLSSPCRNGAACIKIETNEVDENGEKAERWKCKCPSGYMGPTCEISVCEDNPCQYGGTCVQFPGSGYLCLCPLGKHGHYCEHSLPTLEIIHDSDSTAVAMLSTITDLSDLEVALPSFSGSVNGLSSFVAYTVPIPLEYAIELSFKILPQTMSQISLLAFLGQSGFHDEKSDHLAVSFIQGYIMLTWNLGSGPRRIFTQKPIDFRLDAPRVPYEIKVGRIGRQAWLSVDGKFNITGRSPGSISRMDVMPILYLGGHEVSNFQTLPHDLPLHSGFQGCIYDVHLKSGQVTVPLQETRGVRGRGVGQCGTRECHRHACQHDGACLQHGATFTCICQEGWYGPLCAQPTNPCDSFNNKCSDDSTCVPLVNGYECDCPVGKTGKNCEEDIRSLSDVSLTGRRSYLGVRWPYLNDQDKLGSKRSQMASYRNFTKKVMPPKPISTPSQHFVMKLLNEVEKQRSFSPVPLMGSKSFEEQHRVQFFFIEFQLRPLSERGLLLYFGTLNNNQDKKIGFVSLSLQGGVVEFRISGPSNHVTVVRSVRMLAIGEWHKIKMAQRGRWLTLWVEGSASSALAPSAEVLVEPDSLLYIGGLKDLSKLPHNAISGFPIPFRGCVRGLVVSGTRIVLNETNILESRNIRDCDGTACGGDSCESGGHCWLDEKLQPHCICPEYAKGDRCEYSESCKLIPCKNNGRCLRSGRCSCQNGWGGFYCEIAMSKPTTPSFRGNSYLILPPPRIPMKDKRRGPSLYVRPREAIQITMNFSTIEPDGLLLWSEHDRMRFLGLGLESGHLKIASNLLGTNNDTVAAQSSGFIADGAWHGARIILDRSRLELQLDGEVIFTEKLATAVMEQQEQQQKSTTTTTTITTTATTTTTPLMTTTLSQMEAIGEYLPSRSPRKSILAPYWRGSANNAANAALKEPSVTYEDLFYLGGFPKLDSVSERTQGRFSDPFKGCLQDIQFGVEPNAIIKDFSAYQGENIGSCDLHGDEPIVL